MTAAYCHWCGEQAGHGTRLRLARIIDDSEMPGRIVVACYPCVASDDALRFEAELP